MTKTIFSPFQRQIFSIISRNSFITKNFYFTGGTALSEFYLKHRYSEDLDFFSTKDIKFGDIRAKFEQDLKESKITLLDYQFERETKIFILNKKKKEQLKIQFTYWPFKLLEKPIKKGSLMIDSLIDITINKLETLLTRDKARDFVDFYFIQREKNYSLDYLLRLMKKKCLWQVDPLYLGSRLIKIKDLVDYPVMIKKFSKKEMIGYFFDLGKKLKKEIFS